MIVELIYNKEVFTKEELSAIEALCQVGDYSKLTSVIPDMTREKEIELQKIVDQLTPIAESFVSEVQKDMEEHYKKLGVAGPQSPEEEAEWEAKKQVEFNVYVKEANRKRIERMERLQGKKAKLEAKAGAKNEKEKEAREQAKIDAEQAKIKAQEDKELAVKEAEEKEEKPKTEKPKDIKKPAKTESKKDAEKTETNEGTPEEDSGVDGDEDINQVLPKKAK